MKKALLLLVLAAFVISCSRESHPPVASKPAKKRVEQTPTAPSAEVGATMPPYQATFLDGKPFDLAAERGKNVVLLNVWATWCGPCRFEIPQLEAMHKKYAPRGFEVVGVSIDEEGAGAVTAFVKDQPIGYPVAVDPSEKIANVLQTTQLPTSVLIDRGGKIVWRRIGALQGPDPSLDAALEKALGKT